MAHAPSEPTQLLLHRQHSILKNQLRRAHPVPAGTHPGQGRLTLGAVCPSSFAPLLPNLSLSPALVCTSSQLFRTSGHTSPVLVPLHSDPGNA